MKKPENFTVNRRSLLKGLIALPFLGSTSLASAARKLSGEEIFLSDAALEFQTTALQDLKAVLPKGKLKNFEISRLVMGCNPMGGFAHSRDLYYVGKLFRQYHTDEKIIETFALAEKAGINCTNLIAGNYEVFNRYKKLTGSKMISICQTMLGKDPDRLSTIKEAIDLGADVLYIQGQVCDGLVKNGEIDVLAKAVDLIRSQGYPAGVGAHSIQVVLACQKAGIKPDFYFKTMHHDKYWSAHPRENRVEFASGRSTDHNQFNDNIFDIFPEQTVDVFKTVDVPLFGFKVLAGGAIPTKDGFRYAFENGADFICVGMLDYHLVDDVNTATEILSTIEKRERPWFA